MRDDADNPRQTRLICAGLALAVLAVYWPVWGCGFVDFDDPDYVVGNTAIQHGLNWRSIVWAFTATHSGNWHPLTWISHLVDFRLYGLNPAGHHATSLILHAANSVFLFTLLQRMTRARWPSAMTAALFALHPMHVESVAWISERKDVLSTFFWMWSVWAYLGYVEAAGTRGLRRCVFYAASLASFALALMSKPMVVTLPFILLVLDFWPLRRLPQKGASVWTEKIPYVVLAAASSVVTVVAQRRGDAVVSLSQVPLTARAENLPVGAMHYVEKLFWPRGLAAIYPYVMSWPVAEVAGATAFLALVTAWVIWRLRSQPFLAVGWMWFLGGLAPVNGLVQAGFQSMADRYTYLPSVGLFLMAAWSFREWGGKLGRWTGPILGAVALAACLYLTSLQVGYWKNTGTLFGHAVECTQDNYFALAWLGKYQAENGERAAAIPNLEKAVALMPSFAKAQNDLGRALLDSGRADDALPHLQRAVALRPDLWQAHYNLGNALLATGRTAEALGQFEAHVNLRPDDAAAQLNFGAVLLDNRLPDYAIPHLETAVRINPANAEAHYKLGNAYFQKGRAVDAVGQYEQSLKLRPDDARVCNNLAWILAASPSSAIRNGGRAVELASHADQLAGGKNPVIAATLAVAWAEAGKFPEAVATELRARDLADAQKNPTLVQSVDQQLRLFQAGLPFRDTPIAPVEGGK